MNRSKDRGFPACLAHDSRRRDLFDRCSRRYEIAQLADRRLLGFLQQALEFIAGRLDAEPSFEPLTRFAPGFLVVALNSKPVTEEIID